MSHKPNDWSKIPNLIILGEENKQALLFIGGWGIPLEAYMDKLTMLSQDFHVIALGLLGFGSTNPLPLNRSNVKGHIDFFVNKVMPKLNIPDSTMLVGHSTGAAIVVYLAENYPEKFSRLILISPIGNPDPIEKSLLRMILSADIRELTSYNISTKRSNLPFTKILPNLLLGANAKYVDLRQSLKNLVSSGWKINMVIAEDDRITPPGELLSLDGIEIEVVTGGHYWLRNNPELFLSYMLKLMPNDELETPQAEYPNPTLWLRFKNWLTLPKVSNLF
jgi:pimeloyl-ACP methyl ester carboxylesterase